MGAIANRKFPGYYVSPEDTKLMQRYFPRSVHSPNTSNAWIHEDWVKEDFPTAGCIKSWKIQGDRISIEWAPARGKYTVVNKAFRTHSNNVVTLEYAPAIRRLRLNGMGEYHGEDLDALMESMASIIDKWRAIKKAEQPIDYEADDFESGHPSKEE